MDATWRSLGTLCRERDWSKPRAVYELQNGLPYRTVPPGHTVNWHHPEAERSLDVVASTVMIVRSVLMADGVPDLDCRTVGVEVLPPTEAEVLPPPAEAAIASPSAQWAIATVRDWQAEGKIPEAATKVKADLARLLEAEADKAVRDGKLGRALKASYIENQLAPWGIWPLSPKHK